MDTFQYQINIALKKLINYIEHEKYQSYDHFDIWTNAFGRWAKSQYEHRGKWALPLIGPLYFLDMFFPQYRYIIFQKKNISAEALPYIILSYLQLFKVTEDLKYFDKAKQCLDIYETMRVQTKHGIGWGLQFDWPRADQVIPKNTPCVTLSAYGALVYSQFYDVTKDSRYLKALSRIAAFVLNDLNHYKMSEGHLCVSYTPRCHLFVINANAYAARILFELDKFRPDVNQQTFIEHIINGIVDKQAENGSWQYYYNVNRNFIDNLHTCFVLENMFCINQKYQNESWLCAIDQGIQFHKQAFLDRHKKCRHFYQGRPYLGIVYDLRSCAETIYAYKVLSQRDMSLAGLATSIALRTIEKYQSSKGYFFFREYRTHVNRMPYIRWVQAPMMRALSSFLVQ